MGHKHSGIPATSVALIGLPFLLLSIAAARTLPTASVISGYHVLKRIHLEGTEGWDYISMDSESRQLYIGRGNYMDIVDVDSGAIVAKLDGMPGVHGIALAPDLGPASRSTVTTTRPQFSI